MVGGATGTVSFFARNSIMVSPSRLSPRARRKLQEAVRRAMDWEGLESRQYLALTVGGTISSNAHWLGTVDVTSNLTLAAGATLTIDPGTVIKTRQQVSIDISGTVD